MQVINSLKDLPSSNSYALTIGNFDGVHLGHQKLLKCLLEESQKKKRELVVITFVPHPLTILRNLKGFLINSYEERCELLEALGVKYVVELNFTRDFSTLSPEKFMDDFVLQNDRVEALYLGYDFAFGANKKGNHEFVKDHCKDRSIEVHIQEKFIEGEKTYSSTLVRNQLNTGKTLEAINSLGRPFYLKGRVIKGAGRGHQIGFPTANIPLDFERIAPEVGVYATRCTFRKGSYISITNVGYNPTFKDEKELNIETNVFDFDGDLYGEEIKVEFFQKIRDEKKFSSVNELIDQIKKDVSFRRTLND